MTLRYAIVLLLLEPDAVELSGKRRDALDLMLEPHIIKRTFLFKLPDANADVNTLGIIK